ncbi:MAG: Rab GDP dissociation inhibitor alpha [Watsoniomyces obsoletus]|nr:MAG: Rab GDP dissociation inhibitor alpha [Watsoniomyces obsoletus]
MSTNRPFFANFLAAFRAHSAIHQASSSSTAANTSSATSAVVQAATNASSGRSATMTPSAARSITTKAVANPSATAAAVQATGHLPSTLQHPSSSLSRSPRAPTAGPSSPLGTSSLGQRRDSSSSSEGFRDVLGAEKLYIGGRTATGEERFYRLGVAKRHRSIDRLSLDRLSL